MDADVFRRPEIGLVQEMQRISNANSCITDELLWRVTRARGLLPLFKVDRAGGFPDYAKQVRQLGFRGKARPEVMASPTTHPVKCFLFWIEKLFKSHCNSCAIIHKKTGHNRPGETEKIEKIFCFVFLLSYYLHSGIFTCCILI